MCITSTVRPAYTFSFMIPKCSGQIGSTEVNVHKAITIGTEQMEVFETRLPLGLYETITKKVVTMDHARKHVKVGAVKVVDAN